MDTKNIRLYFDFAKDRSPDKRIGIDLIDWNRYGNDECYLFDFSLMLYFWRYYMAITVSKMHGY